MCATRNPRPGKATRRKLPSAIDGTWRQGLTAVDLVNREGHNIDEETIRHGLEGNICRCTGYHNIVKSIAQGAREMGAVATPQAAE